VGSTRKVAWGRGNQACGARGKRRPKKKKRCKKSQKKSRWTQNIRPYCRNGKREKNLNVNIQLRQRKKKQGRETREKQMVNDTHPYYRESHGTWHTIPPGPSARD